MTLREKIVVSAYTGILMCDFPHVHAYIQEKLGRPVFVHELADEHTSAEIMSAVRPDFVALCESLPDSGAPDAEGGYANGNQNL